MKMNWKCPRCRGTLVYENDFLSREWVCLNCGFRGAASKEDEILLMRAGRRPAWHRHERGRGAFMRGSRPFHGRYAAPTAGIRELPARDRRIGTAA